MGIAADRMDFAQELAFWTLRLNGSERLGLPARVDAAASIEGPGGPFVFYVCAPARESRRATAPELAELERRARKGLAARLSDLGFAGELYEARDLAEAVDLEMGLAPRPEVMARLRHAATANPDLSPAPLPGIPSLPVDRDGRVYFARDLLFADLRHPPYLARGHRAEAVVMNSGRPFFVRVDRRADRPEATFEEARPLEDEVLRHLVRCLTALGLPGEAYRTDYVRAHLDPAHHAKIAGDWDELLRREAEQAARPPDDL